MKKTITFVLLVLMTAVTKAQNFYDESGGYFGPTYEDKNYSGAYYTGDYTSPFKTYLNKTDEEIQEKLDQLWEHYFKGDYRSKVFYDKGGEAYILDTDNNDVRSEGISYGMMICVQTNHKSEFDKLWKWAKNHMWHRSGKYDGFFSWQSVTDGSVKDASPTPDAEMYITTALLLAANRWCEPSYNNDAQYILSRMWKNNIGSLFNEEENVICFQPYECYDFSNPSYDLPAFIQCFSRWSDTDKDRWKTAAQATRNHLYLSSNFSSGLFSEYNNFDGTPHSVYFNPDADKYMSDAIRCAMNFGMDYYLFGIESSNNKLWQEEMAERLITHFENDGYQHAHFRWDGTPYGSDTYTLSEKGCNAVACYALLNNPEYRDAVVRNLQMAWDAELATGQYRYREGIVHYLAMLHLCGAFKIWKPAYLVGDANGNGEVEIGDVTSVLTLMATPEATGYDKQAADANGNGEIEIGDVTTILTIMANGE